MFMSRRVTALNKTGIKSLQQGYYSEAICSFRMAIDCLNRDTFTTSSLTQAQGGLHHQQEQEQEQEHTPELNIQPVRLDCLNMTGMLDISPHNTFEIYQGTFAFPQPLSLRPYMVEISLVLVFNLAVAYHLAGFSSSTSSFHDAQQNLRRALKHYKVALRIFRCSNLQDLRLDSCCYSLVLGLMTNMGNLFDHFCNFKETETCRNYIENILSSAAIVELPDDESEFFMRSLHNCYNSTQVSIAAAAAAA
jgi:hypothetical protein